MAGFDAAAFGMSEAEAVLADPQQRALLECLHEAMAGSGGGSGRGGRQAWPVAAFGVYVGVSARDYHTLGLRLPEVCVCCMAVGGGEAGWQPNP